MLVKEAVVPMRANMASAKDSVRYVLTSQTRCDRPRCDRSNNADVEERHAGRNLMQIPLHRKANRHQPERRSTLPSLLLVVSAFVGYLWWKKRSNTADARGKPASKKKTDASRSALPRNKGNNKNKQVNREKRKEKLDKRMSKRREQEEKPAQPDRSDPNDPNNQLIFNYSYFDSARRDHLAPPPKPMPGQTSSSTGGRSRSTGFPPG